MKHTQTKTSNRINEEQVQDGMQKRSVKQLKYSVEQSRASVKE